MEVLTDLGLVIQALKIYANGYGATGYLMMSASDRAIADINHSRTLELIEYYEQKNSL